MQNLFTLDNLWEKRSHVRVGSSQTKDNNSPVIRENYVLA